MHVLRIIYQVQCSLATLASATCDTVNTVPRLELTVKTRTLQSSMLQSLLRGIPCANQQALGCLGLAPSVSLSLCQQLGARGHATSQFQLNRSDVIAAERRDANALASSSGPSSLPLGRLHIDGQRVADPGEPRYTAPYWVPQEVRDALRLPKVLFTDPWHPADEPQLRRQHARIIMDVLRASPKPMTAAEVFDAANQRLQQQREQQQEQGDADATSGTCAPLTQPSYVKHLLEHMRSTRLVYGKRNNLSALSAGHPDHPRLYSPLPYQVARKGKPELLAAEDAAAREKAIQKALKRVRNGKPPFPIHRRCVRGAGAAVPVWCGARGVGAGDRGLVVLQRVRVVPHHGVASLIWGSGSNR